MSTESSYIDYFSVLDLTSDAKPGEVRRVYKKKMKHLVIDIAQAEITDTVRDRFLLDMARLNAAYYILRDNDRRATYCVDRAEVISLEKEWCAAADANKDTAEMDRLRRTFDSALRHFLSVYMEELMLEAGRDKECVEASNWDAAHERHASRTLRHYRQRLYHEIQERLPFFSVTPPKIDWDERQRTAAALMTAGDPC
jgi:curved DNA-binding protein CbpA